MPAEEERALYKALKADADELEVRVTILEQLCNIASPKPEAEEKRNGDDSPAGDPGRSRES
jgi:hypothetical protein